MKKLKWNKAEVEYLKENFSSNQDKSLSAHLHKSPNSIRIKASRLRLKKDSSAYRINLKLTPIEEQVIFGGLMGDLHCRLTHTSKNARVEGGHGSNQGEYLAYKVELLNRLKCVIRLSKEGACYYQSKSFSRLNNLYKSFYQNGKKIVNREVLDKINPFGLFVWYLDDGSYHSRDKSSRLHTNCFTYEEHLVMKEWFEQNFGISPAIHKFKDQEDKTIYYLSFPVSETRKLHDLFRDFEIPECMKYKLYYHHESHLPKSIPEAIVAYN